MLFRSLAVTDQTEMHPYEHWEKRIRFEVRQFKSNDVALVNIPTRWVVTTENEPTTR